MLPDTPIDYNIVTQKINETGLTDIGNGTIREIVRLVNEIEKVTDTKFVRMEMGVPGLKASEIGVRAEIEALEKGVASKYANIEGHPELKQETSRFVKKFLDVDISPKGCIPTVGAMEAAFATFLVANRNDKDKEGTLFIDPGFPVQKKQVAVLGHTYYSFDIYDYRGDKLRDKLISVLETGKISSILYSNPNNPSWICFTEKELKIIGELANEYDAIVIEDLAYFGMDFRKDYSQPGVPPFQPSVAKYCDYYVLMISSSKAFSYAGQRIGVMAISDKLFNRNYPDLLRYYTSQGFGYSMIFGALYVLTAGVAHSTQYALTAMLKAANDGEYNFVEDVKLYGRKAKVMKRLFIDNGFYIVYEKDEDAPIADGFYFTINYPGFTSGELIKEMLYYGISAISLKITGSVHEGIRACVSLIDPNQFPLLEKRLQQFHKDHSEK